MSHTSSAVTYTSVYTNSEPGRVFWGADEELSDGGSLWVIVYGYDGLPMLRVAPPSPEYIPGPEEPQTPPAPQDEDTHEPIFIQPHDPDFMPEPIYPEYIPLEDEHILLAKEQILPPVVSPTAESLGYVAESDPKEDPEEYGDDETEDGPVDYPIDRGDDGDDDDGNSSGYDADDEDEDEEEEEEGKEHLAPANSAVVIPSDELTSISLPPEAEVERLLAMPTPSPSPLTSLSPPSIGERLARCTAPSTLPSPLLTLSLYPPPPVDRRDDILECEQPPRKRLYLSTLGSRYEIGESSTRGRGVDYGFTDTVKAEMRHRGIREVGYGIKDTWIDPVEAVPEMAPTTLEKTNHGTRDKTMTKSTTSQHRHSTSPHDSRISVGYDRSSSSEELHQWRWESEKKQKEASAPTCYRESGKVCHMHSVRCCFDLVEWSDHDLRSRGLCNDLGSTQEENDEQFVANENEKIDKYISRLPDSIYGNVRSSKPRMMDKTTELTNDLMDQKLRTYAKRSDNKRNKVGCRPGSLPICQTLPVSKLDCVLCHDAVAFCLRRIPAFCLKVTAFWFKTTLSFASRPSAFCSRTHCVLSQDGCVLSPRQLRFDLTAF
nr:hypothetical protein [Tanacetum cinerariifolium]